MVRYAIILSVEDYAQFSRTPFCHADASLLYHTLTDRCDYAPQHILLLKLDLGNGETPNSILDRIRQTVDGSKPRDTILFYFAGHGHRGEDENTYLLLPDTMPGTYEKTALPLDDISKLLRQRDRLCFRLFDSCHSGVDVRNGFVSPDSSGFVRAVTHDPTGWVTLAACREDEQSTSDSSLGHGVFTYYVCDEIRSAKAGAEILPEVLKVQIADKVHEHAKKLGNIQTPTLNASISGNISLATRRPDTPCKEEWGSDEEKELLLQERIVKLREVPDIVTTDFLREALEHLVNTTRNELETKSEFATDISVGSPIFANSIPESMEQDVVLFAQRQGLHSRHKLMRWEEEIEDRFSIKSLLLGRKDKRVCYGIWQSYNMPESAVIIELAGDGRCVPGVEVLLYVIPLQLKVCLLVSAFRQGWPPNKDELELLCHSHGVLKPGDSPKDAEGLATLAVKKIVETLRSCVSTRVNELERELG
ncbi:MAG: caspase family protein [bacterium]